MFLDKPVITSLTGNETVNDGSDVLFFCQGDAVPTPMHTTGSKMEYQYLTVLVQILSILVNN